MFSLDVAKVLLDIIMNQRFIHGEVPCVVPTMTRICFIIMGRIVVISVTSITQRVCVIQATQSLWTIIT